MICVEGHTRDNVSHPLRHLHLPSTAVGRAVGRAQARTFELSPNRTSVVALYSANSSRPTTTLTPYTRHRSNALNIGLSPLRRNITVEMRYQTCRLYGAATMSVTWLNATSSRTSALDADEHGMRYGVKRRRGAVQFGLCKLARAGRHGEPV